MSVRSDPDHAIAEWLRAEATSGAPDRLVEATRERLQSTNQRRAWWPARRLTTMNNSTRLALTATAAVAMVAVIGVMFWPRSGGVAGPGSTPSAIITRSPSQSVVPAASPSATPQRLGNGFLEPGTVFAPGLGQDMATSATFTVPAGWTGYAGSCLLSPKGTEAPTGTGMCFLKVTTGLFSDPCQGTAGPADVPVGPTVNDLAVALGAQKSYTSTKPTDVTLGGYSGKFMELQMPADVASCDGGEFTPWPGSIFAQGPANHWRVWILDVQGERPIVVATDFAATPAADLAEQQAIIDSLQFQRP
jgi:hypothetical protein